MIMIVLFVGLGIVAGVSESLLLRNAARGSANPFGVLLRLVLVGGVLFASALSHQLLAGVCGWVSGFVISGALVMRSLR